MSDLNYYVRAYQKNPGSQTDGLRTGDIEFPLGVPASVQAVAAQGTTLAFGAPTFRPIQTVRMTFTAYSLAMTDQTTNGNQGSLQLLTLPAKENLIYPARVSLAITAALGSSSGIVTGAAVVGSMGTAAAGTNNATLTSTEADFVASTACTLTAYVGAFTGIGPVPFIQDGTGGAKSLYLNFAVPDADSGGSDALLLTGTIDFTWLQLN